MEVGVSEHLGDIPHQQPGLGCSVPHTHFSAERGVIPRLDVELVDALTEPMDSRLFVGRRVQRVGLSN